MVNHPFEESTAEEVYRKMIEQDRIMMLIGRAFAKDVNRVLTDLYAKIEAEKKGRA